MTLDREPRTADGADGGEVSAESEAAALAALEAAAEMLAASQARPPDLRRSAEVVADRLAHAAALLDATARLEVMPLIHELSLTTRWLETNDPVRDAPTTMSAALAALLAQLRGESAQTWSAIQLAAIVSLRSLRRQALFCSVSTEGHGYSDFSAGLPADAAAGVLPAFRASVLGLLRDRFELAASALADGCRLLADAATLDTASRLWRQAGDIFAYSMRAEAGDLRIATTRLAVRLEAFLRRQCAPGGENDPGAGAQLWTDVYIIHALMLVREGNAEEIKPPAFGDETPAREQDDSKRAIRALVQGADVTVCLQALRDTLLLQQRYEDWLAVFRLERDGATRETALASLVAETEPSADENLGVPGVVHSHFLRAEAALRRLENDVVGEPPAAGFEPADASHTGMGPSAPPLTAIAVDEALLENLNLAAAEIRGARSRAEANLGSLRGGLQDMERTIKSLRGQLEALEVDSSTPAQASDQSPEPRADGVPARLGALSRGIEELQGLQDALHAITEDTEIVLASQASEDSELEHGLLQTRLVPVNSQFQRWNEAVGRETATGLEIQGGDVMLERRQAVALSDALVPLLRACVAGFGAATLTIDISRPRFDLQLQIRGAGPPIAPADWSALAAGFEPLGAFASQDEQAQSLACRIVLPGPPQSVEVLLIDLDGQRFAIPVGGVAGVLRRPSTADTRDDEAQDVESGSLVAVLGMSEQPAEGATSPTNHVVLTNGAGLRVSCRVDAVYQRERVLVRSPGPLLANHPWVWAVIVNEQSPPTLVLDVPALVPALLASAMATV